MSERYEGCTREELIERLKDADKGWCETLDKLRLLEHNYVDLQDKVSDYQALVADLIEGTITLEQLCKPSYKGVK